VLRGVVVAGVGCVLWYSAVCALGNDDEDVLKQDKEKKRKM
jgi:hypothetical protein